MGSLNNIVLIDVRSTEEYAEGHYPNSINIPLHLLEIRLNELEANTKYITLCRSGARSEMAKNILIQYGFKAQNGGAWSVFEGGNQEN